MLLPTFTYLEPHSLDEACNMLAQYKEKGSRILAGGTDILVDLKQRIFPRDQRMKDVSYLVSLCRIPELYNITVTDSLITIGALVTITEVAEHPAIIQHLQGLAEGAMEVGSPLVRNRGTLAGNIANSRPAADTAGPVIALDGVIIAQGINGERRIPSSEFFIGPGKNILQHDEIIRAIEFPVSQNPKGSSYVKLAVRKALDISVVGVSTYIELRDDYKINDACICLTSVGPTPIISLKARNAIVGKMLTDKVLDEAGNAAKSDARPIDDYRGSAWYRKEMVYTLTKRMLRKSWEEALKSEGLIGEMES